MPHPNPAVKVSGHEGLTPIEPTEPAPQDVAQAIAQLNAASQAMATSSDRLLQLAERREENPHLDRVVINPGNNGIYVATLTTRTLTKSLGVLNPGAAPVYIGVGGGSPTPQARAPSVPGASTLTLPLEGYKFEFGCDSAVLGASTAVVFVFRYFTLQPLALRQ